MKKIYSLIALLLLLSVPALAGTGMSEQIFSASETGATNSTVVSRTFHVGSVDRMGIWFEVDQGASGGAIQIAMDMQGSYDKTSANFVTIATVVPLQSSENVTTVTVTPPPTKYIRFVGKGMTGNATDNTVTAYMFSKDYN